MLAGLLTYPVSIFCNFVESENGFLTCELRPPFNNRRPHRQAGKRRGTPVHGMKVEECIEPDAVTNRGQLAVDILRLGEGVRIVRINYFAILVIG